MKDAVCTFGTPPSPAKRGRVGEGVATARRLRRTMTDAEARLWSRLRRNALSHHFRRQHPEPPYTLDFACLQLKLAVEADGGQHGPEADARRTAFLASRGWHLLRFWNNDILANTDGVIATILQACLTLTDTPSPTLPRDAGEGAIEP